MSWSSMMAEETELSYRAQAAATDALAWLAAILEGMAETRVADAPSEQGLPEECQPAPG